MGICHAMVLQNFFDVSVKGIVPMVRAKKKSLPPPNQPHIHPDNPNVDSETFVSAVPVGGQGRVYFSASVARHPLPPPIRALLSAMEALTSMPPACPPVWLQGAATPQSPAGHHSLQSHKTENKKKERNLYLLCFTFHYIRKFCGRNVCPRPSSLENQHRQMLHSQ